MLTEEQIKQLQADNELLQLQLQDVNYMISIREEELEILKNKARNAVRLQSELEGTYNELSQMQNFIGETQLKMEGAKRREAAMENEIIQSITIEKDYYTIRKNYDSANAEIADINEQLSEMANIYKQLADCRARIAELQSTAEIAAEERELLEYEMQKVKKQNLQLQQGFGS